VASEHDERVTPDSQPHTQRERPDAELLALPPDPDAFAAFYQRHFRAVLIFLLSRTDRRDLAADLCAEVFATALETADRYDAERGPARAWLFTIARNKLVDSIRRGRVEESARRRLGMPPLLLTDEDLERVDEIAGRERGLGVERLVEDLPPDQREAVLARVVDERDYAEIAAELRCSEAVVRQRVSRGLAALRRRLEGRG
jgi:RNA polymerase sigma-70 factor (ECF subfamily)